mmetsp:Transcript_16793/g.50863  ORF Transcript_16793/g.50863 Transcript_16793/m.50863 type:complete len:112 (-) Transcript_16793:315-650(-)|eukprot:scaffold221874_cov31-Tisochrysis_lutea.AAC.1
MGSSAGFHLLHAVAATQADLPAVACKQPQIDLCDAPYLTFARALAPPLSPPGKPIRRPAFYYMGAVGFVLSMAGRYRVNEYKLLGYYPNPSECARAGIEFKALRPPVGIEP